MYQPWLFAATIAGGSGLFAYAAVQPKPMPPDIAPPPDSVHVVPYPVAVPEPVVEPASTVLELEPIVIEAKRHVVRAKSTAPKPNVEASRPCSDWREIGPSHVSQGKPSGTVSVRELCP